MKIYFILIIVLIHISSVSLAQKPGVDINLQSPNIASLGLYGEIPVSHFTGTPSIEIPLHDLNIRNLDLSISLSYHSKSIRPDQHPGWVGLGWNINAGGAIYRIINDGPDDYNNPKYPLGSNFGYFFNHNILNTATWNQRAYLRSVAQGNASTRDTSPDEFTFSFLGYYGKFYLNHQGFWEVQSNKPLKVVFNNTFLEIPFDKPITLACSIGYSPSFSGFTLIGEDGTQYIFGGTQEAIEYSMNFFLQNYNEWFANAWYLTRIITPKNDNIYFNYERGDFINQMYISLYDNLGTFTEGNGGIFNLLPECSSFSPSALESSYNGKLISPLYLDKIVFSNGHIDFNREISEELKFPESAYATKYSDWGRAGRSYSFLPFLNSDIEVYPNCLKNLKWSKLKSFDVYDQSGKLFKNVSFTYNDKTDKRLILKSVIEHGTAGLKGKRYEFEYNNADLLPPYLSNKTDHWGYYNATFANHIPGNYYSYKEPNPSVSTYGLLSKIVYPTGGYTRFVFEPHQYRKQLKLKRWEGCEPTFATNKYAGGVRIKKIIQSDSGNSADEIVEKEYYYTSDYLQNKSSSNMSSGVLGGQIQYYFTDYTVYAFNENDVKHKMSFFFSQSILPVSSNSQNSHIGYTEVIEKFNDNSYNRYQFSNFDNGFLDEPCDAIIQLTRMPYENYASKEQERGLLLLMETYDSNGTLKKKKNLSYQKDKTNNLYVRAMDAMSATVCPGTAVSYDEGTSYKIYTYTMFPQNETEILYSETGQPYSISTLFTYNNKLLAKKSATDSKGEETATIYKYVEDVNSPGSLFDEMKTKNMLNYPVEIIKMKNNKINEGQVTYYKKITSSFGTFYLPDKLYKLEQSTVLPLSGFVYYNGVTKDSHYSKYPEIEYISYNYQGNINEVKNRDGISTFYIWGYNYQYPIVEIINATLTEVENAIKTVFSVAGINALSALSKPNETKLKNGSLQKALPNAQVISYTYEPLVGMTSKTLPNGITTYYEYDAFGRLMHVKDNDGKILESHDYHYRY